MATPKAAETFTELSENFYERSRYFPTQNLIKKTNNPKQTPIVSPIYIKIIQF